jgi:predicted N-formylglutamate amidohydrolase
MFASHESTSSVCARLETTCVGLGLVRLLQDAKRFKEARTVLYALEDRVPASQPSQKRRQGSVRRASRLSRSARSDAA